MLAEGQWFLADPDEVVLSLDSVEAECVELDRSGNGRLFVAERGERLEGACWLRGGRLRRLRHEASLELMVAREARGRGVGRRLLREALAWAEEQPGLLRVVLSVMADNERAIALYRREGFVEEGRRVGAVREADGRLRDDLLMARAVDAAPAALAWTLSRGG